MAKNFLLFVACSTALAVHGYHANLAVIWEANASINSSSLTSNDVTPRTIKALFDAAVTPILVNGSLGRLLLTLFVLHGQLPEVAAQSSAAAAATSATAQRGSIAQSLKDLAATIAIDSFDLYVLQNLNQPLVLFVPHRYLERQRSTMSGTDAQVTGLQIDNQELWQKIDSQPDAIIDAVQQLAQRPDTDDVQDIVRAFSAVVRPYDDQAPLDMHVYFGGHGKATADSESTPIFALLKPTDKPVTGVVAGMPLTAFLRVLEVLRALPVGMVTWNTCYGGGHHAQAVAQLLQLTQQLEERRPFMAMSMAQTNEVTVAPKRLDFAAFFDALDAINLSTLPDKGAQELIKAQATHAARAIAGQAPLILLPEVSLRWQMGNSALFADDQQLVLEESSDTVSPEGYVLEATVTKQLNWPAVVLRKSHVDEEIVVRAQGGFMRPLFESQMTGRGEHWLRLVRLVFSEKRSPDDVLQAFFGVLAAAPRDSAASETVRHSGGSLLTILHIDELRYNASDPDSIAQTVGEHNGGELVLRNVVVAKFPDTLATMGWIAFTYTMPDGALMFYALQSISAGLGVQLSGISKKLMNTAEIPDVLSDFQKQLQSNELFQELAAAGKAGMVKALLELHGRTRVPFEPDEIGVLELLAQRGTSVLPDTFGIQSAYIDAVAAKSDAVGVLSLVVGPEIKQLAVAVAQARGWPQTFIDALDALQRPEDQQNIDMRFNQALVAGDRAAVNALAPWVTPDLEAQRLPDTTRLQAIGAIEETLRRAVVSPAVIMRALSFAVAAGVAKTLLAANILNQEQVNEVFARDGLVRDADWLIAFLKTGVIELDTVADLLEKREGLLAHVRSQNLQSPIIPILEGGITVLRAYAGAGHENAVSTLSAP